MPITQRDIQSSPIYAERNRNWSNAEHSARCAKEFEAKKLEELEAAKAASEAHKGLFAFKAKGDRLKAEWQTASDNYDAARSDSTTKVAAFNAAKKLLDTAQPDTVKKHPPDQGWPVRYCTARTAKNRDKSGTNAGVCCARTRVHSHRKITITAKQNADWKDFSEAEKQVIALYEIRRSIRQELDFINFASDTTNSKNVYLHPEQIHDVLEGREPRLFQSSIKSRLTPEQQVQALREAAIEVVKRYAAPLVPKSPELELERVRQQTRDLLERPAPKEKQKDRDTFKPM